MSATTPPIRILILGGGFAGLQCCKELRDCRFAITLVDRQNHHLFQPLLYQVATAGLSAPEIAQPIRSILSHQQNVTVLMDEVESIDLLGRQVICATQALPYDYLILALGAKTGYFGHPEWEPHAPGLKSLEDAMRIRREVLLSYEKAEGAGDQEEIRRLLTTVVVGGGPTGVEMAGALAELAHKVLKRDFRRIDSSHAKIYLIESGPRLLSMFAEDLSRYTAARLAALGVTVRTGTTVTDVGPGYIVCGGERIEAGNIIWGAGVEASPVTRSLGAKIDRGGRIEVLPDLSVPGHTEVFAVGDLASLVDKNGVKVPGLGAAAMQMGTHAGKVIKEETRIKDLGRPISSNVPRAAFSYFDKGTMATIGRSAAVVSVWKFKFRGWFAWVTWLFVHLLLLIGFRNKLSVFFNWVYAYVTYKRGARIIIGQRSEE